MPRMERARRPPEAGNRAHIPRAIASREAMLWQGCSLSPSSLGRKRRARFGATSLPASRPCRASWGVLAALRVDSLPPICRAPSGLLAALRVDSLPRSVGTPYCICRAARPSVSSLVFRGNIQHRRGGSGGVSTCPPFSRHSAGASFLRPRGYPMKVRGVSVENTSKNYTIFIHFFTPALNHAMHF